MPLPACPPGRLAIALRSGLFLLSLAWIPATAVAQERGYGQTLGGSEIPQQRDAFQDGPSDRNSILDATSPMDLMNRLRKSNALDDATPPSSAIDQALREFEAQTEPATPEGPPTSGPGRLMQAP
jgi:hypothetical protein